jgi:hypothetical protein
MASRLEELVEMMRAFLRDYPELNRLIKDEESSKRSIAMAIMDAVEDFNLDSPLGAFSVENFPSVSLLRIGTTKFLLESLSLLQTRNHVTYSDGQGVQVNESDKGPVYMNLANRYTSEWERRKEKLIVRMNIRQAMGGGVTSDFYAPNFNHREDLD